MLIRARVKSAILVRVIRVNMLILQTVSCDVPIFGPG